MKARFRNLAATSLAVLLAGCVIGWLMTRDASPLRITKKAAPAAQVSKVDEMPYQMAEQIREVVERETEEDAKLAEQEWERVTHQYGTRAFSARPAADLRPGPTGLVVNMRYITRAPLRYEVKSRLFKAIVELMHHAERWPAPDSNRLSPFVTGS